MYKSSFFYSKYGLKKQVLAGYDLVYQGTIKECPTELLDPARNAKDIALYKFVNVWKSL